MNRLLQVLTHLSRSAKRRTVPVKSVFFISYISAVRILCAGLAGNPHLIAMCDEIERVLDTLPELKKPEVQLEAKEMRGRLQRIRARSSSK